MEYILQQGQAYSNLIIMGMQLLNMIVLFFLVHKITAVKKQIKKITGQVEGYLKTVLEAEEESAHEQEESRKAEKNEAQTKLISSVLEEIFP